MKAKVTCQQSVFSLLHEIHIGVGVAKSYVRKYTPLGLTKMSEAVVSCACGKCPKIPHDHEDVWYFRILSQEIFVRDCIFSTAKVASGKININN